jgi:2-(1,2-epoxy-1,2-dihydrophenyl)acetyl-CoA isomerase
MDFQTMTYDQAGGVGRVTFNRPERMNAVSAEFCSDLAKILDLVARDESVGCLVLTGAGRAFSSGGDLNVVREIRDLEPPASRRQLIAATRVMARLYHLEKITIARVNGPAIGAGAALAVACDFVIAADDALFGFVFSNLGLVPDMGTMYLLPRIVGLPLAKKLCYEGNTFSAQKALEMGLISEVVAAGDLDAAVNDLAGRLAAKPRANQGLMKTILQESLDLDLDSLLVREAEAQALLWKTADHQEAIRAFFEKRPPRFGGRPPDQGGN